jgi:hypothetical protein
MYDIFYVSRHNICDDNWLHFKSKFPRSQKIEYVKSFDDIKTKSFTKLFWVVWDDLLIVDDCQLDYVVPKWDEEYIHVFKNDTRFDGINIFSKEHNVSQKEFTHRFFTNKKEIDLVLTVPRPYDKCVIDTYEDYLNVKENAKTERFWLIPKEVEVLDHFDFKFQPLERTTSHVFKHIFRGEETYTGISLISKNITLTEKEIKHRFLIDKKQHDIVASKVRPYDIVFISYNEPNADKNFIELQKKFPRVKRVHGVKGIHQAHIKAAGLADTVMFWVVDGDAVISKDFNFDYEINSYERDIVHVWRSKNPINDLVYGYGGVKLLPTQMTIDMDLSKPDMTTSISNKFKAVKIISNITSFNTDPFNTWKSAFRECCKLSSKVIDRQKDVETNDRLDVWCSVGGDRPYGKFAIEGAKAGREYGEKNRGNIDALKKINDFEWLKRMFDSIYE